MRTVAELRAAIPAGGGGSTVADAVKMRRHLDAQMVAFVRASPFVVLATADAHGLPYVSPKGDAPGFVHVVRERDDGGGGGGGGGGGDGDGAAGGASVAAVGEMGADEQGGRGVALLLPDRPGNRLLFGLQNVVGGSGRVGLLFEIPGNHHTLRCGGRATLSRDPALLARLGARGRDAKAVLRVEVEYAFFHCAKAYLRSRLWEPESWPPAGTCAVRFGPYFAEEGDRRAADAVDAEVAAEYAGTAAAVAGTAAVEPD